MLGCTATVVSPGLYKRALSSQKGFPLLGGWGHHQSYYPLLVRCLIAALYPPFAVTFLEYLRNSHDFFFRPVSNVVFLIWTYLPLELQHSTPLHIFLVCFPHIYFCLPQNHPGVIHQQAWVLLVSDWDLSPVLCLPKPTEV